MLFRSDNPIADYERYSAHQESELNKLPKCSYCDEPIQQDTAVYIDDEPICDECLDEMRREVRLNGF